MYCVRNINNTIFLIAKAYFKFKHIHPSLAHDSWSAVATTLLAIHSSVFRGGNAPGPPPPRKVRKHFLTRYTVKNGISNLYILLKSVLKMQEMPFQRSKFQKIFGGAWPPYNCVITMASPSLKSWLRHWLSTPLCSLPLELDNEMHWLALFTMNITYINQVFWK